MVEFTGERVIPQQVEADLWNEHFSRYQYANQFAAGKRVLDLGCGTGYGTAELAQVASFTCGIDVAADALAYARHNYPAPHWVQASAASLPLRSHQFDLVTAFEVIEHLPDWDRLLAEASRLLAPSGLLLISTPNRLYYAESRQDSGPNPFHAHEFTADEFQAALAAHFAHVELLQQNHTQAVLFQGERSTSYSAQVSKPDDLAAAHFFLAVASATALPALPGLVVIPQSGNLLRERERHIRKLQTELAQKNQWITDYIADRANLLTLHAAQEQELHARTAWAAQLNANLEEAGQTIGKLQEEQRSFQTISAIYEQQISALEEENLKKTDWAISTEHRLTAEVQAKCLELAAAVDALHATEHTLAERTQWAIQLDQQVATLTNDVTHLRHHLWSRLGRLLHTGPR